MSLESIKFNQKNIEEVKQTRITEGKADFVDFEKHFRVGDTLVVSSKLLDKEGKTKIFKFEGLCTKKRGTSKNFFVKRNSIGEVSTERSFYYFSKNLSKIEVVKKKK
jgi:ribosomal protein L19